MSQACDCSVQVQEAHVTKGSALLRYALPGCNYCPIDVLQSGRGARGTDGYGTGKAIRESSLGSEDQQGGVQVSEANHGGGMQVA
jgi:hypothetical protein